MMLIIRFKMHKMRDRIIVMTAGDELFTTRKVNTELSILMARVIGVISLIWRITSLGWCSGWHGLAITSPSQASQ